MAERARELVRQAMALQLDGRADEAARLYRAVLAREPLNPDANHLLGLIAHKRDEPEQAAALIEKAIAAKPDFAPFHHNVAGVYRALGRLAEAEAAYRRAIALEPDYGEAYQGLAETVRFAPGDAFIERVEAALRQPGLTPLARAYLHFAAGKYGDDVGSWDDAFAHYREANALAARPFDAAAFTRQVRDIIYHYAEPLPAPHGTAAAFSPLFVVGMPRSGTSLAEQILASHPDVFGAGEVHDIDALVNEAGRMTRADAPFPAAVAGLDGAQRNALATGYQARIEARMGADRRRHVDKLPLNFVYLGFIFTLFPDARVVHTVRHPLDTCLSCYFQHFTNGQNYSFALDTLASFYRDYRRLMQHWAMLYPGRILELRYENLVEQPRRHIERLLAHCGLTFDPACLQFHENRRSVTTASFGQVRQPIYTSSVGRWRHYARHLEPLARVLGVAPD